MQTKIELNIKIQFTFIEMMLDSLMFIWVVCTISYDANKSISCLSHIISKCQFNFNFLYFFFLAYNRASTDVMEMDVFLLFESFTRWLFDLPYQLINVM